MLDYNEVIKAGVHYGYRACCIKNYVNLLRLGYYPGVFMDAVLDHHHHLDYVLCPICYEKYNERFPNRKRTPREMFWGKKPEVDKVFSEYESLKTRRYGMKFVESNYGDPSLMGPDVAVDTYLKWHLKGFGFFEVMEWFYEECDDGKGDIYESNTSTITEYVEIFDENDLVIAFNIELSLIYHGGPASLTIDICPELVHDPSGKNAEHLFEFDSLIKKFEYWPDTKELRMAIKSLCDGFLNRNNGSQFKFNTYK